MDFSHENRIRTFSVSSFQFFMTSSMQENMNFLVLGFLICIFPSTIYARINDTYDFFQGLGGSIVAGALFVSEEEIFVVNLGGSCNGTYNCRASYSNCTNQVCKCLDGFVATKEGTCRSTRLFCPNLNNGVPQPLDPRNVRPCHKLPGQNDTTPCSSISNTSQEFCFLHPLTKNAHNSQVGHCCPKPQIGSKLSYGVCPVHPSFNPNASCEGCYDYGEQCIRFKHWSSANSYSFNSQCCPLPCRTTSTDDTISVDGVCYLNKYIDEPCQLDVQCKTPQSYCASVEGERTCACKSGYSPKVSPTPTWLEDSKRTTCVKT